jgi:hypothetical protein
MSHAQDHPEPAPTAMPASATDSALSTPSLPVVYEPPAIIFRARLEATAAFCGEAPYGKSFGVCDSFGSINS